MMILSVFSHCWRGGSCAVLSALLIGFIDIWGGEMERFRIKQPPLSSTPESSNWALVSLGGWTWVLCSLCKTNSSQPQLLSWLQYSFINCTSLTPTYNLLPKTWANCLIILYIWTFQSPLIYRFWKYQTTVMLLSSPNPGFFWCFLSYSLHLGI